VAEELALLREDLRRFVTSRVRADLVDDVVQEVMLRLLQHRDAIHGSARGWAHRVARNAIADVYRARRVDELEEELPAPEPEDESDVRPLALWLRHAIDTLPDPYRETLRLTELEGLGYADVAEREGVSRSAIKSRVVRGREKLRLALLRCCEVELDARGKVIDYAPRGCGC